MHGFRTSINLKRFPHEVHTEGHNYLIIRLEYVAPRLVALKFGSLRSFREPWTGPAFGRLRWKAPRRKRWEGSFGGPFELPETLLPQGWWNVLPEDFVGFRVQLTEV